MDCPSPDGCRKPRPPGLPPWGGVVPGEVRGRGVVPGEWRGRGERWGVPGEGGGRPDVRLKDSPARFLKDKSSLQHEKIFW